MGIYKQRTQQDNSTEQFYSLDDSKFGVFLLCPNSIQFELINVNRRCFISPRGHEMMMVILFFNVNIYRDKKHLY